MKKKLQPGFILAGILLVVLSASCSKVDEYDRSEEIKMIEEFMSERGYDITPTESGLYYKEILAGTGDNAVELDTVVVKYSGYYLNGIKFQASTMEVIIRFDYPEVIEGFNEALTYMNTACESIAIMPSWLAYGSRGSGQIPPYTPLLFELEVVEIRKAPLPE